MANEKSRNHQTRGQGDGGASKHQGDNRDKEKGESKNAGAKHGSNQKQSKGSKSGSDNGMGSSDRSR